MGLTYAKVIADSVSPSGNRLTTIEAKFHRFVLAEMNTHRVFSRNSASSRAIPVQKILNRLFDEPAFPLSYPAEQAGMQGGQELLGDDLNDALNLINELYAYTVNTIQDYVNRHFDASQRLHKSVLNRYLEPFMYHTAIISSTEWENFFHQRCSPLAQPEIREAAEAMREALHSSTPIQFEYNDNWWHTPYVTPEEQLEIIDTDPNSGRTIRAISVARCARVSYLTHDGKRDWDKDLDLYDKLRSADPPHLSPFEHVATPFRNDIPSLWKENILGWRAGNFDGWAQLRHLKEYQ